MKLYNVNSKDICKAMVENPQAYVDYTLSCNEALCKEVNKLQRTIRFRGMMQVVCFVGLLYFLGKQSSPTPSMAKTVPVAHSDEGDWELKA